MFSKLNRMENVKETSNPSESKDDVEHLEFDPPEMEKISSIPVPLDLTEIKYDQGTEPESYENFDKKIKIHCCLCGNLIEPNPANTCVVCLKKSVDVSEGISLEYSAEQCRTCERWHGPPWGYYERESNDFLKMLMKKIKGITKEIKILESQFVWSEPHSKRIKIKLTLSKDVLNGVL